MNTELQTFEFQSHQLTLIADETGEPWFVAKEVAEILEYSDAFEMTKKLDEDEVQNRQIAGFGNRGVNLINESGLYSLIITSRKPEAKAFKKWVTSEVLPSIRKTGSYIANNNHLEQLLAEKDKLLAAVTSHSDLQKQFIDSQNANHETFKEKANAYIAKLVEQNTRLNAIISRHSEQRKDWQKQLDRAIRAQRPIADAEKQEIIDLFKQGWDLRTLEFWFYRSPSVIRRTLREAGVIA